MSTRLVLIGFPHEMSSLRVRIPEYTHSERGQQAVPDFMRGLSMSFVAVPSP